MAFLIIYGIHVQRPGYYISFALNSHRQKKQILAHTCSPIYLEAMHSLAVIGTCIHERKKIYSRIVQYKMVYSIMWHLQLLALTLNGTQS